MVSKKNKQIIYWLSENDHFDILRIILEDHKVDFSLNDNYILNVIIEKGNIKQLQTLLQCESIDISYNNNISIRIAYHNNINKVTILLKDNRFIMTDYIYENLLIMDMIYQIRQQKINYLLGLL